MADELLEEQQRVIAQAEDINKTAKELVKDEPQGVGRPTVIDEKVVGKLLACFNVGLSVTTACQQARISRDAFYDRMKTDVEFSDKMLDAQNWLKIITAQEMTRIISKGADRDKVQLIKFIMPHHEPEIYGETQQTLVQNNITYVPPTWFHPEKIAEKTSNDQAIQNE